MPDDAAFLSAILADPSDDLVRLVYADWLEEHDDPRGPFIRAQTELAHLPPNADGRERLAARAAELFPPARDAYCRAVPAEVAHYFATDVRDYGRGLLHRITVRAGQVDAFGGHAAVLWRHAPVEQLSFEPDAEPTFYGGELVWATATECVTRLLQIPALARLMSLILNGPFEDLDAVVAAVVAGAAVAGLHHLEFGERPDERDTEFRPQEMSENSRRALRQRFGDRARFR
jgi:uncharacterized protein (TIGR02996 family)